MARNFQLFALLVIFIAFLKKLLINYTTCSFGSLDTTIAPHSHTTTPSLSFRNPQMPQTPTTTPKEMTGCIHHY
jgi:hypothetical protein